MNRAGKVLRAIIPLTFFGLTWLISPIPTYAATTTDKFEFRATGKEWCRGNLRFFETFHVRPKDNITMTVTRDPLNSDDLTNIQATITNTPIADINAITMNGLDFPTNKAGHTDQVILLGTLANGHFLTIRGQAILDKLGNLNKVTGTFWRQVTSTYTIDKHGTQSAPVDCFLNGTFVTGKKLP